MGGRHLARRPVAPASDADVYRSRFRPTRDRCVIGASLPRARDLSPINRVADGGVTEVCDLHPLDRKLVLAGEHCAALHTCEAVDHQPSQHLCREAVRQHECFGATRDASGEQLKGPLPFAVCGNVRHGICSHL
jgi:hypothetical protein